MCAVVLIARAGQCAAQESVDRSGRIWLDEVNTHLVESNTSWTNSVSATPAVPGIPQPETIRNQTFRMASQSTSGQPFEQMPGGFAATGNGSQGRFITGFGASDSASKVGTDFYSAPEFAGGVIVYGQDIAMKIGGYVKADFIYDFDPIDSTDSFDTTTIPVGATPRTNSRFHARQTRLSMDTRWIADDRPIRFYVESDFFSDGDRLRLRRAFGESGALLFGQTWTTFTDVAAAPATLDFEGSVSSVNRRQAQARFTRKFLNDRIQWAVAVEDTRFLIELPPGVMGESRSPSPDFVSHLRLELDWARFHVGSLYRIAGFQPDGMRVSTSNAWGFNFTGVIKPDDDLKVYFQVLFGNGIGSYRNLPDAAPTGTNSGELLPLFGWMVGTTRNWTDTLSSNFTLAENSIDSTLFQDPNGVRETTYLAANLIWSPYDRIKVGIEYLHGVRVNVDGQSAGANRIQASFIFELP